MTIQVLDAPAGVFYIYPLKKLLVVIGNNSHFLRVAHFYVYPLLTTLIEIYSPAMTPKVL